MRFVWIPLAALSLAAGRGGAQDRPSSSASDVVRQFLRAADLGRWSDAAALVDTRPIEELRRNTIRSARRPVESRQVTADEYMRMDPQMPRAVAEYQVEQARRARDEFPDRMTWEFADVTDTTMLARLSPLELTARWLQAQDVRYQIRRAEERAPRCRQHADIVGDTATLLSGRSFYGVVETGESAYAVYSNGMRDRANPHDLGAPPNAMELRKMRGRWLIVPNFSLVRNALGVMAMCIPTVDTAPPK